MSCVFYWEIQCPRVPMELSYMGNFTWETLHEQGSLDADANGTCLVINSVSSWFLQANFTK